MLSNLEMLLRLALAAGLGSIIGIERQRLQWTAGLRTHMLVSVGAALFMLVSLFGFSDILGRPNVVLDPSRVAAQVVSGIGFLGAGAILFRRDKVRGLTTAASLWTVAAIGLAVGGGLYVPAVGGTVAIFSILAWLKPLERRWLSGGDGGGEIRLRVERATAALAIIQSELASAGMAIRELAIEPGEAEDEDELTIRVQAAGPQQVLITLERLRQVKGVRAVSSQHRRDGA
jgi:putative Mg2+ transporter-C (MgtC) family protein